MYDAGTAALTITVSFRGIQREIRKQAEIIAKELEDAVQRGLKEGYKGGDPTKEGAEQGDKFGDAFALIVKKRIALALRTLPDAKIGADTSEVETKLAAIRGDLKELSGKRIGIDINRREVEAQLDQIKAELERLAREAPTVTVTTKIAKAMKQLELIKTQAEKLDRENPEVKIKADPKPAERSMGRLLVFTEEVKRRIEATLKTLPAVTLKADSSNVDRNLVHIREELTRLGGKTIGVDISEDEAIQKLHDLKIRLDRIASFSPSVKVAADTAAASAHLAKIEDQVTKLARSNPTIRASVADARAKAEMELLSLEADKLGRKRPTIKVDVDKQHIGRSRSLLGGFAGDVAGIFGGLAKVVTQVGGLFGDAGQQAMQAGSGMSQMGQQAAGMTSQISGGGGGGAGGAVGAVLQFTIQLYKMAGIIVLVQGLAGALTIAIGGIETAAAALPGIIFGAAAAVGVLILAFKGVGKAIQDGWSGNTKAFKKDLKNMSPAARTLAEAIVSLKKPLTQLQKIVQQDFFGPFAKLIKPLAQRWLPLLVGGLGSIARTMGGAVAQFLRWAKSTPVVQKMSTFLDGISGFLSGMLSSLTPFMDAFLNLAVTSLPFLTSLGKLIEGIAISFDNWTKDPKNMKVLQDAFGNLMLLLRGVFKLVGLLAPLFLKIFADKKTKKALQDMFATLTDAIKVLGPQLPGLVRVFDEIMLALQVAMPMIGAFLKLLIKVTLWVLQAMEWVTIKAYQIVQWFGGPFKNAFAAVGSWFAGPFLNFFKAVGSWFTGPFVNFFKAIGSWFTGPFVNFFKAIGSWFTGPFVNFFKAIGSWFTGPFVNFFKAVGSAIAAPFLWFYHNVIIPVWDSIKIAVRFAGFVLLSVFLIIQAATHALGSVFVWLYNRTVKPIFDAIARAANWLWTKVLYPAYGAIVNATRAMGNFFLWIYNHAIKPAFDAIARAANWLWTKVLYPAFNAIKAAFRAVGNAFLWVYNHAIKPAIDAIARAANWLWTKVLYPAFNAIKAAFRAVGNAFLWVYNHAIKPAFDAVKNAINFLWTKVLAPAFRAITGGWHGTGNGIKSVWDNIIRPAWNAVKNAINFLWTKVLAPAFRAIKHGWSLLGDLVRSVWNHVIKPVWHTVQDAAFTLKNKISDAFEQAKNAVSKWWGQIKGLVKKPVIAVIKFVRDGVLGSIKKAADKFGFTGKNSISSKMGSAQSSLTGVINKVNGFAGGGHIRGAGGPTADKIPAWLSNGEYVVRAAAVRRLGLPFLNKVNQADQLRLSGATAVRRASGGPVTHVGAPGFARGGPSGGNSNYYVPALITAIAKKFQSGVRMTSGYRSNQTEGHADYHNAGLAADLVSGNMDALAASFYKVPSYLLEEIHTRARSNTGWYVKNGRRVSNTFYGANVPLHRDHVHIAMSQNSAQDLLKKLSGKSGASLLDQIKAFAGSLAGGPLSTIDWVSDVYNKYFKGPAGTLAGIGKKNGVLGEFMGKSGHMLWDKAMDWFKDKISSISGPGGDGTGYAKGIPTHGTLASWIRQAMKLTHVDGKPGWFNKLYSIAMRESRGDPRAVNDYDINAKIGDPTKGVMQIRSSYIKKFHQPGTSYNLFDPIANISAAINYIKSRYGTPFNTPATYYDNGGILKPGFTPVVNHTGRDEYVLRHDQVQRLAAQGAALAAAQIAAINAGGRGRGDVYIQPRTANVDAHAVKAMLDRQYVLDGLLVP